MPPFLESLTETKNKEGEVSPKDTRDAGLRKRDMGTSTHHPLRGLKSLHSNIFLGGSVSKESACSAGDGGSILGQKDPLEKKWEPAL